MSDPTAERPVPAEEGGDPACWAHLFDGSDDADEAGCAAGSAVVVDLGSVDSGGRPGVVWSLPHGGDLDGNLVHLDPGGAIAAHANPELDVVLSVVAGEGRLIVDGTSHPLRAGVLALVPRGARREIRGGGGGLTYLSIHRRRGPLGIGSTTRPPT